LCCDGTLFADVELRPNDDAKRLKRHGLTLEKKRPGKLAFAQPCAGFEGKLCGVYHDRPKLCRLFECRLLKRVKTNEIAASAALKTITIAKRQVEKVRGLLLALGQRDESMALTRCYAAAMGEPIVLTDEKHAKRLGKMMLAANDLMTRLQRDFRRPAVKAGVAARPPRRKA
jgi:Fe-S-cluster containining protein